MQPQAQPDGGHDMTGSSAGDSTVDHCVHDCLPSTYGRVEPPQLGGETWMWYVSHDQSMWYGSYDQYTHKS